MPLIQRAKGLITNLVEVASQRVLASIPLLASIPPAARGRTQRLAEQVLKRAAERWPGLASFMGQPPKTGTWHPPAWSSPESDPAQVPPREPARAMEDQTIDDAELGAEMDEGSQANVATSQLRETARSAREWQERRAAVRTLAARREAEVFDSLLAALTDPAAEVAAAAVESLNAWAPASDERVARALVEVLSSEGSYHDGLVRTMAAGALAKRLPQHRGEPLLDAVGDAEAEVSVAAILALAEGGFDGAAERMLEVLEEPSGFYLPLTRQAAARGLSMVRGVSTQRVAQIKANEKDPAVRDALPG